jgi:hypothetical protein
MPASKKQIAIIRTAFDSLPTIEHGWSNLIENLYDKALAGEKRHRGHNGRQYKLSAADAARLFSVKWLAEYTIDNRRLGIEHVLTMREDCVYAAAIAAAYPALLKTWVKTLNPEFHQLDYAALVA